MNFDFFLTGFFFFAGIVMSAIFLRLFFYPEKNRLVENRGIFAAIVYFTYAAAASLCFCFSLYHGTEAIISHIG